MSVDDDPFGFSSRSRGDWVRLRTLINLRWLAIAGQALALYVATRVLGFDIRLDLCALLVGLSAAFNIGATLIHPENKRLTQRDATLTLLFDLGQLALLLYLTGGLTNPFAVLVLAQTIIAATVLTLRATVILGAVSLVLITLLALVFVPLTLDNGQTLMVPGVLIFGTWAALSISIVFIGTFARRVSQETFSMSEALTATQLALEQEQKLTALGGVVAAAAHELGTPLATIKLASSELIDDLQDHPDLREDVVLIREQTDRCRDILASMGQRGKEDLHMRQAPFSAVVEEAAEPHLNRGKHVIVRTQGHADGIGGSDQPAIPRRPEIVHGLRNLIQNAVDFAQTSVWVDIDWSDDRVMLRVGDDGAGFPPDLLGRIGDPFVRRRGTLSGASSERPGYKGMGLGLFIAKTLLERTGARLTFANGVRASDQRSTDQPTGAIVEVIWDRDGIEVPRADIRGALGANKPLPV